MFHSKYVCVLFIILLGKCATSDNDDSIRFNRRTVERHSRSKYRYNHPPEVEDYQSIPVAIVYDDVRQAKSSKETTTRKSSTKYALINKDSPSEASTVAATEHQVSNTVTVSPNNGIRNKARNSQSKIIPENQLQIPVAVVYDPVPNNLRNVKRNNQANVSGRRLKVRKYRRRKQKTTENPVNLEENTENAPVRKNNEHVPEQIKKEVVPVENTNILLRTHFTTTKEAIEDDITSTAFTVHTDSSGNPANVLDNTTQKPKLSRRPVARRGTPRENIKTDTNKVQVNPAKPEQEVNENIDSTTLKPTPEASKKTSPRKRQRDPVVPIIESENHLFAHKGEFQYSYEGGDGTKAFEKGELKSFEDETAGESVVGGFSYKDKEGNDFSLSYTADERGYRPVGAHLPTPPPVPPAIARALRYLATKTTPEPVTESYTEPY